MLPILEQLTDLDEVGIIRSGQSNGRPWGHRDDEGFIASPHLKPSAAGADLTILAIVGAVGRCPAGVAVVFDDPTDRVQWTGHPMHEHDAVAFAGGSLPGGILAGEVYYVVSPTANDFAIARTPGGAALAFNGGTGTTASLNHGPIGSRSVVSVAEEAIASYWVGGELRLVQFDHADDVAVSRMAGHARVVASGGGATNTTDAAALALAFDTDADQVVWQSHGIPAGALVVFQTDGTLPGLSAGVPYYVRDVSKHRFRVAASPWGAAVALAGGAGVHSAAVHPWLLVEWQSVFGRIDAAVAFAAAVPGSVQSIAHGLPAGSVVSFEQTSPGDLPPELTAGHPYVLVRPLAPSPDVFWVAETYGGLPLTFSTSGGTPGNMTLRSEALSHLAGYVHLHDRFNAYDNVQVVTPYQPIAPGDYPAGVPVVPGVELEADVETYADAALVLPFTFNEGVEGYGTVGSGTVAGLVVNGTGGAAVLEPGLFVGGFVRCGAAKGRIAENTATTITVDAWDPPAGPGAGTHEVLVWLPHWRNNPHHYTAGEGFLYPSNDMQPGGASSLSTGYVYSRPRGQLQGSYVGTLRTVAAIGPTVNDDRVARLATWDSGQLVASIPGAGVLRLQRFTSSRDAASGLIQFEDFLRAGHKVLLQGFGAVGIDGAYRVQTMGHTYGATGSFVDLVQLSETDPKVPAVVTGTVPAGATVSRIFHEPQHRIGSLLELSWRLAVALGRRIVVTHLSINSSGQVFASINNGFGFQGQIGWRDDDNSLDWTPSHDDGNAARLRRLVEFIAPRAVRASFGADRQLKVLAIDEWQLEADSLSVVGRELAPRSIPAFAEWLRDVVTQAGLSPYLSPAKIPIQWAQLPSDPWELEGYFYGQYVVGDKDGAINAALRRFVALDGFAATVDTNASGRLDGTTFFGLDPLHFNGFGGAVNGRLAANALLPLIDYAFSFGYDRDAVAIANMALSLIGEPAIVRSLNPPDDSEQAQRCAEFFVAAKEIVLQMQPWTFATERVELVAIDSAPSPWTYCYALPPNVLNPIAVLDPESDRDVQQVPLAIANTSAAPLVTVAAVTQPYRIESEGPHRVLRTHQADAVLWYVRRNVPLRLFDPLVRQAVAWQLGHLLAGATVRGTAGTELAQRLLALSEARVRQGARQNMQYHQNDPTPPGCEWLP